MSKPLLVGSLISSSAFDEISRSVLTVLLLFSAFVRNDFGVRANVGIFFGLSLIVYSLVP